MDSQLNKLSPLIDFDNALVPGQMPNENAFRSAPFKDLVGWLQGQLDIRGAELLDPVAPGTQAEPAVIPSGPEDSKGKFEPQPGFYQGFPEVTPNKRWYFYWDMNAWSLKDMGALPKNLTGIGGVGIDVIPLYNKTEGSYVDSVQGEIGDVEGYDASDFIDISQSDYFEINPDAYQQFAFYDENRVFKAGTTIATKKVLTPKGAKFARFSISETDLENFYVRLFKDQLFKDGKNKLRKDFSRSGFFVNALTGTVEPLGFYSYSHFIPAKQGDIIRYEINSADPQSPKHLAFFTEEMKYHSGNVDSFTNPMPVDGYFIISVETDLVDLTMLTINDNNLKLVSGVESSISKQSIKELFDPYNVTVRNFGGDFQTLNDAVEYGKKIATKEKPFNIHFIGHFYEHVNIALWYINLWGLSPQLSIIQDDSGNYHNVPVNASGRNNGANFTALATNSQGATPTIWAYGIHLDHEGSGKSRWFNCDFISYVNAGVGLGTQDNQQFEFIKCRINSHQTADKYRGGLYMHNSPYVGHRNMSVLLQDCIIESELEYSIVLSDANTDYGHNDDDGTSFTFINCMAYSKILGKSNESVLYVNPASTGDIGQIKLGAMSFGNNVTKLNK